MRVIRARWVLPIDRSPIAGGWVTIDNGRIVEFGDGKSPAPAEDLGDVAILPGLVNAHTHLELSWMSGRVPPAACMNDWIRTLVSVRRTTPAGPVIEEQSAREAAAAMRAAGTVLVGDVTNNLTTSQILRDAGIGGVVFHELLGFNVSNPAPMVRDAWARIDRIQNESGTAQGEAETSELAYSVVAHAPYSVSPALFGEIARSARAEPLSVHLAESPEELEFLRTGRGPIRESLELLGVWDETWKVPATDPVRYLTDVKYLRPGVLAVHGVYLTSDGLDRLRHAGAVLVTCPRSNEWVGAGAPPVTQFYASRIPVAIGTDSLASVPTLSLWDELAELRRLAPEVSAGKLLDSATRVGAAALGRERDYGTIAPGKRAALIAVDIPAAVPDVEEYLVSGIAPGGVRRL